MDHSTPRSDWFSQFVDACVSLEAKDDPAALEAWLADWPGGGVAGELIVGAAAAAAEQGGPCFTTGTRGKRVEAPDNRGSPVLVACELDCPKAVELLLSRGADVNYRHPASHGNCALLRCAEAGMDDCLAAVLAAPDLDASVVTREYKLVLGQHIPQYEAGGRTALLLAVEASRAVAVKQLLSGPKERVDAFLTAKDSFGRDILSAAFQHAAMKSRPSRGSTKHISLTPESPQPPQSVSASSTVSTTTPLPPSSPTVTPALSVALDIARQLCEAAGRDFDDARAELMPTYDNAVSGWRARNVELRRRFLTASHAQREAAARQGLATVAANYTDGGLRLHPEVYAATFPSEAIRLSPGVLDGASTPPPTDPSIHSAQITDKSVDCARLPPEFVEPAPGVFHFPLLSAQFCSHLFQELEHYEATARSRPELDLPLRVRHDGNFGSLQDCGFEPVLRAAQEVFSPLVERLMPSKGECEVYHAFLTRNWPEREENATFKVHCDKSDLTMNICLHASDDLVGSTVGFYADPDEDGVVPGEALRIHTLEHQVGHAVLHDGASWHKTDPIIKGTRASLIIWARLTGTPCAACGASTGAKWLFCKVCGAEIAGR